MLLPMSSFAEENGVVTSLDRWALRRRAAINPPGEARPSDFTLTELAQRLGASDFGGHPAPVLQEIREAVPAYARRYGRRPRRRGCAAAVVDAGARGPDVDAAHAARAADATSFSSRRAACSRYRRARSRWCAATARTPSAARTRWSSTPRTPLPWASRPATVIDVAANGHRIRGLVPHDGPAARRRLGDGAVRGARHCPRPER